MKKMSVVVVVMALAVSLFGSANAGGMSGIGGGCGNCAQPGSTAEQFRKFQADTIDLRQEMMTRRFELQRENLKGRPDEAKIALLQAYIGTLQSKILAIRSQSGLPVDRCDGECARMMGGCGKGRGGCINPPCGALK